MLLPERIRLAAGEVAKIEVARSGVFHAKVGGRVDFTPRALAALARTFDPNADHRLKIGHDAITTSSADYGDVVGLEYDEDRDRLFAAIVPTEALVQQNRSGAYRRVSMELAKTPDGYRFEDLAFLGAHRAAIPGLAMVALAAGDEQEIHLADLADLARRGDVTAMNPGVRFARSERHERVRRFMLAHPQVRYTEALELIDANPQSAELHLAAEKEIAEQSEKGNSISYLDAVRRVEMAWREDRLRAAGGVEP
ncbi:MAG TPA: hypothetical protein VGQ75_10405 [Thermoanaerobaculia bacterium]|jgi:hypothetical protein|nr:hypothetical protein [Thermoanaerobaculia bacterium]HEV8608866.1 hypothetical protein [Thermoanaerobaculia bacterium]